MKHRGSLHSSDQQDAAESYAKGFADCLAASADLLEQAGEARAAQILREAKITMKEEGE